MFRIGRFAPESLREERTLAWCVLTLLQVLTCVLLFSDFMFGDRYFVYRDIGSDTLTYMLPQSMHLADYVREEGFPGWSFSVGLGAPLVGVWDPFLWPYLLVGSENAMAARIWVFMVTLILAGWSFYGLLRKVGSAPFVSMVCAYLYTFCGYALVNAQWDPFAKDLVLYPLLTWAVIDRLQGGAVWRLTAVTLFALAAGIFFVSIMVFLAWLFVAFMAVRRSPKQEFRRWMDRIAIPVTLGFLLAAPILIPFVFQLLESPRVSGSASLWSENLAKLATPADVERLISLAAGFFHKDLLQVGNAYRGVGNYLEGPVFYVGIVSLILIPQLMAGDEQQRRTLWIASAFMLVYCLFPAVSHSAFAFALPYYRVSCLWISMLLLFLAAQALQHILTHGVNRRWLVVGLGVVMGVPLLLWHTDPAQVWEFHLHRVLFFSLMFFATLWIAGARSVSGKQSSFVLPVLCFWAVMEASHVGWQSFFYGRMPIDVEGPRYSNESADAIDALRPNENEFWRIANVSRWLSLNDPQAQGYHGVTAYNVLNSASAVRIEDALGLLLDESASLNYTNWLRGPRERYMLHSVFGVRYLLSRKTLDWPGLSLRSQSSTLYVYENLLAFPLGVLHHHQIPFEEFVSAPLEIRDRALLHAVVTDESLAGLTDLSLDQIEPLAGGNSDDDYANAAAQRRRDGLVLGMFSENGFAGSIHARRAGALVFSIPFDRGWRVKINGRETALYRVNLGMMGVKVSEGVHEIEASYQIPGLRAGFWIAGSALLVLLALGLYRDPSSAARMQKVMPSP